MASDDEIIRLVMQVQGEESVKRLRGEIDKHRDAIRQLDTELQKGNISQTLFDARAQKSASNIAGLNQQLASVQGGLNAAGRAANDSGMKWLMLQRFVEDAQYGFGAVVNNIPQLVQAMGGSAGLAGAISLVAVAINQNISKTKEWMYLLREIPGFKTAEKAVMDNIVVPYKQFVDPGGRIEEGEKRKTADQDFREHAEQALDSHRGGSGSKFHAAVISKAIADQRDGRAMLDALVNAQAVGPIYNEKREGNYFKALEARKNLRKSIAEALTRAQHGDESAIEMVLGFSDHKTQFGRAVHKELATQMGPGPEAMHEITLARQKADRERNAEGQGGMEKALADMTSDAVKKTGDAVNGALKQAVIAAEDKGQNELERTKAAVRQAKEDLLRIEPALKLFPKQLGEAARTLAVAAQEAADRTIEVLMANDRITRAAAVARLNRLHGIEMENARQRLAGDEFNDLAAREERRFRRLNPGAAPMGPRRQAEMAEQMRKHFEDLGLNPEEQKKVARILQDPIKSRVFQGVGDALVNHGIALPGDAARKAIKAAENAKPGANLGFGVDQAINKAIKDEMANENKAARARRAEFNLDQRGGRPAAGAGIPKPRRRAGRNAPGVNAPGVQAGEDKAGGDQDVVKKLDELKGKFDETIDAIKNQVPKVP